MQPNMNELTIIAQPQQCTFLNSNDHLTSLYTLNLSVHDRVLVSSYQKFQ